MNDWLDDDEAETVPCPSCGEEVYEEAEQCPTCGQYVTPGSGPSTLQKMPAWWVALGILGVVCVILMLLL